MQTLNGNIWRLMRPPDWLVITTNVGWRKHTGEGIFGAGLAKQALTRDARLPHLWGEHCREHAEKTGLLVVPWEPRAEASGLILFPTKALDPTAPWTSWWRQSSIPLIKAGLSALPRLRDSVSLAPDARVLVPLVGCRNGGLRPEVIEPLIEKHLAADPLFWLVKPA